MARNRHRPTNPRGGHPTSNGLPGDPWEPGNFLSPLPDLFRQEHPFTPVRSNLSEIEDGRYWHPDPIRNARTPRQWVSRFNLAKPVRRSTQRVDRRAIAFADPQSLSFRNNKHVVVCVRRKQRREVLFAKGRGGGGKKRGRRNYWSNVRC